jgi:hypothetical protein
MNRPEFTPPRNFLNLAWIALLLLALTPPALADIYRWEDEAGVLHFTDDPSSIPERYRGRVQDFLKAPPPAGKPGLSTIGGSAPRSPVHPTPPSPPAEGNGGGTSPVPSPRDSLESQAEQLRAKIGGKEQFIGGIDAKRSNILNPLGNRFVSPEDLELYKKYSAELPGDRERLREIESRLPPGVN